MNARIWALCLVCFSTNLGARIVDPVIPMIAQDLNESFTRTALLAAGFTLPYGLIQPVLGSVSDQFGKARVLLLCVLVAFIASAAAPFATSFEMLFGLRLLAGLGAGGLYPLAMAIAGDLVSRDERTIVLGRMMGCAMGGVVLGAAGAGIIADLVGWRGVFLLAAIAMGITFVQFGLVFRGGLGGAGGRFDLGEALGRYRSILQVRQAKYCFGTVFLEGLFIMGLLPFVGVLLYAAGETRATIAGVLVAAFALGGFLFSAGITLALRLAGQRALFALGASLAGLALLALAPAPPWQVQTACFALLGFGMYMLHVSIQAQVTELVPASRGSAVALHTSSTFVGQSIGPVYYGWAIAVVGAGPAMAVGAVMLAAAGFACSRVMMPVGSDRARRAS